ncbi:hypothetical protein QTL95_00940 [Rhizobium sp. S152]|uniref:hypothetical protein n=1 Tax=Rhizobium sp. S152 TaxID=3055038 RepID=UPI0025A984BB|nr:hypothetical protein [Rhizobium sp. S152]MDM9624441.1 hypothetical protein [Rhizobium sp. S152]
METIRRIAASSITHVLFAFVAMGGWAVFANRDHSALRAGLAGLVQGGLSACLTLFLKKAVEFLAGKFDGSAPFWAPPLIACIASTTILVLIHALSGTPEILKTIAVPLAVSTSYATAYSYSLTRRRRRQ